MCRQLFLNYKVSCNLGPDWIPTVIHGGMFESRGCSWPREEKKVSQKEQIEPATDKNLTIEFCLEVSFKRKEKDSSNPEPENMTVPSPGTEVQMLMPQDISAQAKLGPKTIGSKEGGRWIPFFTTNFNGGYFKRKEKACWGMGSEINTPTVTDSIGIRRKFIGVSTTNFLTLRSCFEGASILGATHTTVETTHVDLAKRNDRFVSPWVITRPLFWSMTRTGKTEAKDRVASFLKQFFLTVGKGNVTVTKFPLVLWLLLHKWTTCCLADCIWSISLINNGIFIWFSNLIWDFKQASKWSIKARVNLDDKCP